MNVLEDHQLTTAKPFGPSGINGCLLVQLPKVQDTRGNLTFIEGGRHVPFQIERVFYLYDVPGGAARAGHALKTCYQFLVAMSGSFDVVAFDGVETRRFHLCRSYYGLLVPPLIWRALDNFSSGSVCLALASGRYDESDYFRDQSDYLRARQQRVVLPRARP